MLTHSNEINELIALSNEIDVIVLSNPMSEIIFMNVLTNEINVFSLHGSFMA